VVCTLNDPMAGMIMNVASGRRGTYKPGRIRDRNLESIIYAAEKEFVKNGFRGTTIQTIADRAGLPKSNVRYYFGSKEKLYLAVLNDIMAIWNEQLGLIDDNDDPAVALDRFIQEKIRLSFAYPDASKLFAMEIISGAPYLRPFLQVELRKFASSRAKIIQKWIDKGLMRNVDPMQLIFLIWSSTQHYADFDVQVLSLMKKQKYSDHMIRDISRGVRDMILTGCGLSLPS